MNKTRHYLLISLCATTLGYCFDAGSDSSSLDKALKDVNVAGGTIDFSTEVKITDQVRAVNADASFTYANFTIIINGKNQTLNGQGSNARGFFVGGDSAAPQPGSVRINDLAFENCQVIGGTGSGGGMGAGGGLFVGADTTVELINCSFTNCSAVGGKGTFINSKFFVDSLGGGGMRGQGAPDVVSNQIISIPSPLGGGGFGGDNNWAGGGASGFAAGNATGINNPGGNFDGVASPAGGGIGGKGNNTTGTAADPGGFGGGGGGHGASLSNSPGGKGGFGGGGGGGFPSGNGGFGGGGGNGGGPNKNEGLGGFGGGGGTFLGIGGFGGGDGSNNLAGAGAAFGGAIFIQEGADLSIFGTINFSGNSVSHATRGRGGLALGADIFMMSGSTITFDTTASVQLQNPIEGNQGDNKPDPSVPTSTGGLIKKGGQTLGLSGANTYTGTTTVEGGILQVNGSLVSNVEVEPLGTLLGTFDLKKDATGANGGDLTNKGIFIASPQTNVEGLYKNESGIFQVDITPTGTVEDKTYVIGNADITGGDLQIFVGEGNYISGTQYTLITGNVMGAFANQADPTLIGPNAENVKVEVTTGSLILTVTENNFFPIILPIDPINPDNPVIPILTQQVALCLQASNPPPGSDLALVIESLGTLPLNQRIKALQTLSARLYGSLEWINERNNSYSAELLTHHLSELYWDCDCNFNGWATVFGNIMNNQKELDNLPRYNADSVGVLAGVDFSYNSCFTTGAAFGYTRTHVLWRNDSGGGSTDSYYGALYGDYESECFGVDFSILGGGTFNDMRRHIDFANIDRNANSDYWSYFVTGHFQIEPFRFISYADHCMARFEPFAIADYHYYTHGTFAEEGADSLNLSVESNTQHFMRGEAGIRWSYEKCCACFTYSPYIGASWVGEFPIGNSRQPASFIGQSCVIDALSYKSDVHLASPQAGIRFAHCNGASLQLGYKGLFNNSVRINEIEGRFEWIF